MTRRLAGLGLLFALSAIHGVVGPAPLLAQAQADGVQGRGALRAAVRLSADTVRVGEPFTVGIVATATDSIAFPRLLETGDAWEQLEVGRVEHGESGEVRVYYRVVPWETGQLDLPAVELATGGPGGRTFQLDLRGPWVSSVLPADAEDVRLRGPRGPLGERAPWLLWLALLAALAAAVAWWWWRRRRRADTTEAAVAGPDRVDPRERALAALAALREEAASGAILSAVFYDRLEVILREYLAEVRAWPPTRPVRASSWLSRGRMRDLHRHAVMARFGGVGATDERRLADVDTSIDWLRKDAA